MKATLDLPEPLFREVKARAAREGIALRIVVGAPPQSSALRRVTLPLVSRGEDIVLPALTNEQIDELLD